MGSFSIWHWMIVLVVLLLLFGRGKIPDLMGDVAKGIKNFKQGMSEDDTDEPTSKPVDPAGRTVEHRVDETIITPKEKVTKP